MFGPDYAAGCPNCSAIADGFNGFAIHLANHDVMLWAHDEYNSLPPNSSSCCQPAPVHAGIARI
jgi:hypothetical protein